VLSLLDVEAESAALYLVRALYDLTDGLPQQWCMLEELGGDEQRGDLRFHTRMDIHRRWPFHLPN
jgi:hypothetical protein